MLKINLKTKVGRIERRSSTSFITQELGTPLIKFQFCMKQTIPSIEWDMTLFARYIPYLLQLQLQPRLFSPPPLDQSLLYCLPVYSAKNRRRNMAAQLPSPDCRPVLV